VRLRSVLLASIVMAALFPSPVRAEYTADLSFEWTVTKGDEGWANHMPDESVERQEGPLTIGKRLMVNMYVTNNGPEVVEMTIHFHLTPDPHQRFSWHTAPIQGSLGVFPLPNEDHCTHATNWCTAQLQPGQKRWYGFGVTGTAPGSFSLSPEITADLADPDDSNNSPQTMERQIVCSIEGTSGNDKLRGTSKQDSLCGYGGADRLAAIGPNDVLFGGRGNDFMLSDGEQRQIIVGNEGFDIASFAHRSSGFTTMAVENEGSGQAGTGLLSDVEGIIGTPFDDRFEGAERPEWFWGGRGDDTFKPAQGSDHLFGGPGRDHFNTKDDGQRDILRGGPGVDTARFDSKDVVSSVRRTSEGSKRTATARVIRLDQIS
jgi:hypothetical protein